jgi:putative membrane protein
MRIQPYEQFDSKELLLRDLLATDRTLLALERTTLAYIRTSFSLIVAGFSIIHFVHDSFMIGMGVVCVGVGFFVAGYGLVKYREYHRRLCRIREKEELVEDHFEEQHAYSGFSRMKYALLFWMR